MGPVHAHAWASGGAQARPPQARAQRKGMGGGTLARRAAAHVPVGTASCRAVVREERAGMLKSLLVRAARARSRLLSIFRI